MESSDASYFSRINGPDNTVIIGCSSLHGIHIRNMWPEISNVPKRGGHM